MAIYITGDTHGEFTRFRPALFPPQTHLSKEDYVIICGDFGGVWDRSPEDEYWLNWLEKKSFTTLFLDGNHENFDLLSSFPTQEWNGGLVQHIRPSVIHLMRGQIYHLQGLSFFVMGGARSHDITGGILEPDDPHFRSKHRRLLLQGIPHRINHRTWWREELPSQAEYQTALASLDRVNWTVDCILTHCCPSSLQQELFNGRYPADPLTDFLDEVARRCRFKSWFFGHYHQDRSIKNNFNLIYEEIMVLKP